jgi:iron complex transport system substrate-binding protein
MKSILDIGRITGASEMADRLVTELRSRRDSITAALKQRRRPRVLIIFSLTPLMVAGSSSFINELITDAGGSNIGAIGKGSYPIFSREEILTLQPEKIILTSDITVSTDKLLQQFPEWRTLDALRSGAVSSVDASLISRPGPRVIQGIAELARIIHQ